MVFVDSQTWNIQRQRPNRRVGRDGSFEFGVRQDIKPWRPAYQQAHRFRRRNPRPWRTAKTRGQW